MFAGNSERWQQYKKPPTLALVDVLITSILLLRSFLGK